MLGYLLKTLIFAVFTFIIAYFYYFGNSAHIENFDGYLSYIVIIGVIYGVYKFFQFEFSEQKASFSIFKILGFFLLHLLVLSVLFFIYNDGGVGEGVKLFFMIVYYSIIPIGIILISLSFGKKITSKLKNVEDESDIYKFIISLGVGFFSFLFLLDIFGILGFYNLYIVFGILIGFIIYSYKELINILNGILNYTFVVDIEEGSYFKLITTEFLFLVSTLVLSISLISIVRPFPIGWDDLGAYMNLPHLMAEAGTIIPYSQMYAWQTLTGIGYMFGSPTQAFFLNNIGGVLSFILLVLITSDLLKVTEKNNRKTFINIPMLVGTIFISLPMIVFQQAKDMKLDAGAFFVSIISLYLIYKYYLRLDNKSYLEKIKGFVNDKILHKSFKINNLLIILVIGIIAGLAFTIKFTTMLLIAAIIGLMVFARLGVLGFIGYLGIFFAIFTKANLWKIMNVVVNPDKIYGFETSFAIISGGLGIGLLGYTFNKNKLVVKKLLLEVGVLLLGIIIALSPWLSKNIVESYPNISISNILSGTADNFDFDTSEIYSEEELKIIEDEKLKVSMSAEGITANEDYGRYFGYEKGANNYLKLPWNLTMQVNQGGEFTDIGFLFLALLPVVLLFLPFRKKYYSFFIVIALIFELLIFIKTDNNVIDNTKLSSFANLSSEQRSILFQRNDYILQNKLFNKDIYDIKVSDYISKGDIAKLVNESNTFDSVNSQATDLFYEEIKKKVSDHTLGKDITLTKTVLSNKDFEYINDLRFLHTSYSSFNIGITSLLVLEETITKLGVDDYKNDLIKIWKDNRTINQSFSDFFATYNLPNGYLLVLIVFIAPVIFLLYLLGGDKHTETSSEHQKITLFKFNLIFASFYTFLWAISAYGIVWYGIVMYFSFLFAIAIGVYYISSYSDEDSEKEFYIKLFGSLIFSLIIIIYISNSVMPHSFNNLKKAGYKEYKTGVINIVDAPYRYHSEYLKILYHLNINQDTKEEFLKKYIREDIKKGVTGIEKMSIYNIRNVLSELIKNNTGGMGKSARISLDNVYKNISNPSDEFKSKVGIYRIGTFLKYHISENNKRLLNDSLVSLFNNYIYNESISETVENMKKVGLSYLLVDLNAATIDQDTRHNLTTRYERLLKTFTSDKLELLETDSICLKVALEGYSKSKKTPEDLTTYMGIAGVNFESYTPEGKQIGRGVKLMQCFRKVDELIKNKKIDKNNYSYLLAINNHVVNNPDSFKTENQIFTLFQQQILHGYKALFKIK